MGLFAEVVHGWNLLTIFVKNSILVVWSGSNCARSNCSRELIFQRIQKKNFFKTFGIVCTPGYSVIKKLDAAFCYLCILALKIEIPVSLWQGNAFFTKRFQNWKKNYYIVKKVNVAHLKNTHKIKVTTQQITLPLKEYDNIPEMHEKNLNCTKWQPSKCF